jgi:hypothetical protein
VSPSVPLRRTALAGVLVTASVAGYAGAAAFSALASPAIQVAADFGPGDGLTRYVLTADAGLAPGDLVRVIAPADGVVNAQPVGAGVLPGDPRLTSAPSGTCLPPGGGPWGAR